VEIDGIDQKPALEIAEGDVPDQTGDEGFERFAAIERWGKEAPESDIRASNLEDVPTADQSGSGLHLLGRHSGRPSCCD
jgi:hypothetical protein